MAAGNAQGNHILIGRKKLWEPEIRQDVLMTLNVTKHIQDYMTAGLTTLSLGLAKPVSGIAFSFACITTEQVFCISFHMQVIKCFEKMCKSFSV